MLNIVVVDSGLMLPSEPSVLPTCSQHDHAGECRGTASTPLSGALFKPPDQQYVGLDENGRQRADFTVKGFFL